MATNSVEAYRRGHRRGHRYHRNRDIGYGIGAMIGTLGAVAAASNARNYGDAMRENRRLRGEIYSLRRENNRLKDRVARLEKKRGLF
jgi:hypothetical protein